MFQNTLLRSAITPLLVALLLIGLVSIPGCSGDKSDATNSSVPAEGELDEEIRSAADLNASGAPTDVGDDTFRTPTTPLPDAAGSPADGMAGRVPAGATEAPRPGEAPTGIEEVPSGFPLKLSETPDGGDAAEPDSLAARLGARTLRQDLTPEQLLDFLQESDRDLQLIASGRAGIRDEAEARQMMQAIEKKKLEAALQLKNHDDASGKEKIDGARGQLQALSHLASMGDLASGKALKAIAAENIKGAEDPSLLMDSRIVLIGFEIDALQSGKDGAADRIVELINELTQTPSSDIPALLSMGQARQMLARYGQTEQAGAVRDKILSLYGNAADPIVAKVAAEAAGSVKFDRIERLLIAILKNEEVALDRWTDAAIDLMTESPDMTAVQYLAESALQLEAAGREGFVEETFTLLREQFTDPESATAKEIEVADKARQARKAVIGRVMKPDLLSVEGAEIDLEEYRGKVVLMPFWAITIPGSLQVIPMLKQIRDQHPDDVAILGMNLDPEDAPLPEFLAQAPIDFENYRSVSSATESVVNPVAVQFGLVSMPFVAILDQNAKVVALDFTGTRLSSVVDELLPNNSTEEPQP